MNNNLLTFIILLIFLFSCDTNYVAKPYGYYRLEFPKNRYEEFKYKNISFEKSIYSKIKEKKEGYLDIIYPKMNATIHCTYRKVKDKEDFKKVLQDIEKFTYKHSIKADDINESLYENKEKGIIGMFNQIEGNSATNTQFYLTNQKNVFAGSLYFFISPNYDSLLPAIKYIEKDIKILMETLEWE